MQTAQRDAISILNLCMSKHDIRDNSSYMHADIDGMLQIVLGKLLGKGMFGQTYLGCWRGGDLAVKCVRVSKESEAASFLREVAALAAIRHPNVMQFYGNSLHLCISLRRVCLMLCPYTVSTILRPGA